MDPFSIGSSDRDVGQLDRVTGKSVSCKLLTIMNKCSVVFHGLPTIPGLDLNSRWSIACWRSGIPLRRTWVAFPAESAILY